MIAMAIEQHLTIREVSQRLKVNARTIRRWLKAGKLVGVKLPGRWGGEWRIPMSEIEALGVKVIDAPDTLICQGNRADGQPCNAPAVKGSNFCRHHQPNE